MTTLANYPNYSQLAAKINGPNDCVPTSIKDAVKYLTDEELDLDGMVTAVYGPNYHGFTSARAFVPYIAQHGVKLFPIDGDNATLVPALHEQIKLLHPCLLTEPDPYAPLHPDWSHVLSVYREDPGSLTARDPYSTHDVTHTDAQWASLLEFREIWVMERITMSTLDNLKANGWHDDGTTLLAPNGVPVVLGFRAYVLANNWAPGNYPVVAQYYTPRMEDSNPALGAGDQQPFYDTLLGYPHAPQAPYEGLKDKVIVEYVGKELVTARQQVAKYYAQVQDLQKQLAAGQQPTPTPDPRVAQYASQLQQIGTLSSQIDTLSKAS